jgi:hypothetical protein
VDLSEMLAASPPTDQLPALRASLKEPSMRSAQMAALALLAAQGLIVGSEGKPIILAEEDPVPEFDVREHSDSRRRDPDESRNRYTPHQGAKEKARRLRKSI